MGHKNRSYRTGTKCSFESIIGKTPVMNELRNLTWKVADSDSTVLLLGETGTGKNVFARAIHYHSYRRDKPWMVINCGAIPEQLQESVLFGNIKGAFTSADRDREGLIEAADGSTIFLNEIGDMSPTAQVKLLHFLDEGEIRRVGDTKTIPVDSRVIAATNVDIDEAIRQGKFREDLFYRLSVIPVRIPPLRERRDDIPLLVKHFLKLFAAKFSRTIPGISARALTKLIEYDWPGNVRELENVMERAVLLTPQDEITEDDLLISCPNNHRNHSLTITDDMTLTDVEQKYILYTLEKCQGNQQMAAERLNIGRVTLWRRLKEYNVNNPS